MFLKFLRTVLRQLIPDHPLRRSAALMAFVFALTLPAAIYCPGLLRIFPVVGLWLLRRRIHHRPGRMILFSVSFAFLWMMLYGGALFLLGFPLATGESVPFTATVTAESQQTEVGFRISASVESAGGIPLPAVLYWDEGEALQCGDTLTGQATFYRMDGSRRFLSSAARGQLLQGNISTASVSAGHFQARFIPQYTRTRIQHQIEALFSGEDAAVLRALYTGDSTQLSDEYYEALQRSGVTHMYAVSGLHVTFFVTLVLLFTGGSRWASLLCLPLLLWFCLMTGCSPSVVRAAVMETLLLLAPFFQREADNLTSLGLSALLLLLCNPYSIFNVSLQLSFCAMLGILVVIPLLIEQAEQSEERSGERSLPGRLLFYLRSSVVLSIAATVFTVPLCIWHFGSVSLISVLSDILVVPFLSIVFSLGALTLAVSFLWIPLCVPFAALTRLFIFPLVYLPMSLSTLPFAVLNTDSLGVSILCTVVYLLLLCLLLLPEMGRKGKASIVAALLALSAALFLLPKLPTQAEQDDLTVQLLNVGQGECVVFYSQGDAVAVDCGGVSSAGDILLSSLSDHQVASLSALVVTHYDRDHINGVETVLSEGSVETLYLPNYEDEYGRNALLTEAAEEVGTQVCYVSENTTFTFGTATLSIFAPISDASENDSCVTACCTSGTFDVLVTGDLSAAAEYALVEREDLHGIEALVVSHHGSKYSSGNEFLNAIQPDYALISVGKNGYGHPTEEVLERLEEFGCTIYRTDLNGTVTLHCQQED